MRVLKTLTTYRVMAVATSIDDRYGYGESRVVTSRRLMARPALPRFVGEFKRFLFFRQPKAPGCVLGGSQKPGSERRAFRITPRDFPLTKPTFSLTLRVRGNLRFPTPRRNS